MVKSVTVAEIRKLYDLKKERKMISKECKIGAITIKEDFTGRTLDEFIDSIQKQLDQYKDSNKNRIVRINYYGDHCNSDWDIYDVTKVPESTDNLIRRLCIEENRKRKHESQKETRRQKYLELQKEFGNE